ncbi:hypothetical protein ACQP2T_63595 (plasmid) [Nonomuraea sp. CA-143628]|uniref:hypothetical protein n=1 Tax=Nonomuraea sp. CA-143628 TaxID=3239997 RepID=UPI003D8C32E4
MTADRNRAASMRVRASTWENADFTTGHRAYRQHLENVRVLLMHVEYVVSRDTDEAARWLRQHGKKSKGAESRACPRMPWLEAFFQSVRYRFKGKLVAELVQEAAKDAVLMASVHAEYLLMEGDGAIPNDRYRKDKT